MTDNSSAGAQKVECPFCEGDRCCFCDYTGRVTIGERFVFTDVEQTKKFRGKALESDLRQLMYSGGLLLGGNNPYPELQKPQP